MDASLGTLSSTRAPDGRITQRSFFRFEAPRAEGRAAILAGLDRRADSPKPIRRVAAAISDADIAAGAADCRCAATPPYDAI